MPLLLYIFVDSRIVVFFGLAFIVVVVFVVVVVVVIFVILVCQFMPILNRMKTQPSTLVCFFFFEKYEQILHSFERPECADKYRKWFDAFYALRTQA